MRRYDPKVWKKNKGGVTFRVANHGHEGPREGDTAREGKEHHLRKQSPRKPGPRVVVGGFGTLLSSIAIEEGIAMPQDRFIDGRRYEEESPKPRLLDRVRQAIRARHYSRSTEKTYVAWIRRFILFHARGTPRRWVPPRSVNS